jgi:hypothetical protein
MMRRSLVLGLLSLALSLTWTADAEAKRTVIIYQDGHELFPAGPLPAGFAGVAKLKGAVAGYRCRVFGLFLAHFHIWNCQPVAFSATTVIDSPKLAAAIAQQYPKNAMQVGFWKKNGRWVMFGGLLLVVAWFLVGRRSSRQSASADPVGLAHGD